MAEPTEMQRFTDAMNTAIRKAAQDLLERSRNLPAPCGCAPKARCDRHCRVKIRLRVDEDGRAWVAECNGGGRNGHVFGHGDRRVWCLSLPALHKSATEHIRGHRARLNDGGAS